MQKNIKVVARKLTNENNRWLHWEIIREMCISFNADLLETMPESGDFVYLSISGGCSLKDFVWPRKPVIISGCDDDGIEDNFPYQYPKITIETPANHFLWSPIAIGIALNDYYKKVKYAKNNNASIYRNR